MAEEKDKNLADDPEFEEKHRHLELFLHAQELLLVRGRQKPAFANDREKLRYLHFVLGAIDQLSRTVKDEERSELWAMTTSMARAVLLFPAEEAMRYVYSYGQTGDLELRTAGEKGWKAMHTYILNAVGKASKDDFRKSCTELFYVVHGTEPKEP